MFSRAVAVYFHKTKAYNSKPLYDTFAEVIDPVIDKLSIEDIILRDGYESRDDMEWTDITFMANGHGVTLSSPHFDKTCQGSYVYGIIYGAGYTRDDIDRDNPEFDLLDTHIPLKRLATGEKVYSSSIVEWLTKYVL